MLSGCCARGTGHGQGPGVREGQTKSRCCHRAENMGARMPRGPHHSWPSSRGRPLLGPGLGPHPPEPRAPQPPLGHYPSGDMAWIHKGQWARAREGSGEGQVSGGARSEGKSLQIYTHLALCSWLCTHPGHISVTLKSG